MTFRNDILQASSIKNGIKKDFLFFCFFFLNFKGGTKG